MFWTKVAKFFLRFQVVVGVIGVILIAISSGFPEGIGVLLGGVVAILALSCVMGMFIEIAEGITKISNQVAGKTQSEIALERRLNSIESGMGRMLDSAKKQGSAAVKKTAEKIVGSIQEDDQRAYNAAMQSGRQAGGMAAAGVAMDGGQNKAMAGAASGQNVSGKSDIDRPLNFPIEDDLDETMAYQTDEDVDAADADGMDKTTVLPMDVIMEKVNGGQEGNGAKSKNNTPKVQPAEDARFCPSCGAKNNVGSAFCYSCGSKL